MQLKAWLAECFEPRSQAAGPVVPGTSRRGLRPTGWTGARLEPELTTTSQAPVTLSEASRFWFQLGWVSFGGPAGQIAAPLCQHLAKDNEGWGIARFSVPGSREEVAAMGVTTRVVDLGTGDFALLLNNRALARQLALGADALLSLARVVVLARLEFACPVPRARRLRLRHQWLCVNRVRYSTVLTVERDTCKKTALYWHLCHSFQKPIFRC